MKPSSRRVRPRVDISYDPLSRAASHAARSVIWRRSVIRRTLAARRQLRGPSSTCNQYRASCRILLSVRDVRDAGTASGRGEYVQALRSMLFTPGNRSDLIEKAIRSGTDAVIVDLEDAVPLDSKVAAREALAG